MNNAINSKSPHRGLMICSFAGAAVALATAAPALAINDSRAVIRWSTINARGANGSTVVIGNVEAGQPLTSHQDLRNKVAIQFHWPFANSSNPEVPRVDRNWVSTHATATTSALVGQDRGPGAVRGLAPNATVLSGSIASGFDNDGNLANENPTSLSFALFAMGHQPTANAIADALDIPRYQTASVINMPLGTTENGGRLGEDTFSRVANAIAFMSDATVVAAAGDDGELMPDPDGMDMGTMVGPGSGHNTIGVAALDEENNGLADFSSEGPMFAVNWAVAAGLFPKEPSNPMTTFPTEQQVEDARPGPDISAPGAMLRLSGSQAASPFNETAFSDFWTGTSFSSSIVAAAAALVHDLGNKQGLWPEGRPSGLLTRALLLNSADKGRVGFSNMASPGDPPSMMNPEDERQVSITTQALDSTTGAGVLNLQRLVRQFADARFKDYTTLEGFTKNAEDPPGYDVPAVGTDPNVPFVTVANLDLGEPVGLRFDASSSAGPALASASNGPSIDWNQPATVQLLQNGPDPNILDPDGGVTIPPRPVPFPDFPTGGGEEGGGGPFGPSFRSGWDLGNIGFGTIDLPIGIVTPNSTITATLVWNRTETWDIPDYAAALPLATQSQAVSFPTGAALAPPAQAPLQQNGALAERAPQVGDRIKPTRESTRWIKTVEPDGHCSRAIHAPIDLDPADLRAGLNDAGERAAVIDTYETVVDLENRFNQRQHTIVGANEQRGAAGGLDIQYVLTPDVQDNQEFVDALLLAAEVWESVINDDVTVRVAVDFTEDQGFIAATSLVLAGFEYPTVRQMMINDAAFAELSLLNALPTGTMTFLTPFEELIATTSEGFAGIGVAQANLKALNIPLPSGSPDLDAFIFFNTDFNFDNDPSDGVSPSDIDTVFTMVHEIGHMLGFISNVDSIAAQYINDFDPFIRPTPLDMFRFGVNDIETDPNTRTDFQQFSRQLNFQNPAALDTVDEIDGINQAYRFSQGVFSDGRQASHWQDDIISGETIGVMDPTDNGNGSPPVDDPFTFYITQADKLAFSLIGWDISLGSQDAQIPVVTFPSIGDGTGPSSPGPLIEFKSENLDMELWRRSASGFGNTKLAASRTQFNNVEHIFFGPGTGPAPVEFGDYFIRILFVGTEWDFGGYMINMEDESMPLPGFTDLPRAEVKYALAWYIDLARTPFEFITDGGEPRRRADLNADGVVNSADLAMLLSQYGQPGGPADINGDGAVDSADLAQLLADFDG